MGGKKFYEHLQAQLGNTSQATSIENLTEYFNKIEDIIYIAGQIHLNTNTLEGSKKLVKRASSITLIEDIIQQLKLLTKSIFKPSIQIREKLDIDHTNRQRFTTPYRGAIKLDGYIDASPDSSVDSQIVFNPITVGDCKELILSLSTSTDFAEQRRIQVLNSVGNIADAIFILDKEIKTAETLVAPKKKTIFSSASKPVSWDNRLSTIKFAISRVTTAIDNFNKQEMDDMRIGFKFYKLYCNSETKNTWNGGSAFHLFGLIHKGLNNYDVLPIERYKTEYPINYKAFAANKYKKFNNPAISDFERVYDYGRVIEYINDRFCFIRSKLIPLLEVHCMKPSDYYDDLTNLINKLKILIAPQVATYSMQIEYELDKNGNPKETKYFDDPVLVESKPYFDDGDVVEVVHDTVNRRGEFAYFTDDGAPTTAQEDTGTTSRSLQRQFW